MKIKKVWGVYFSGTGTTKKVVENLARIIGEQLHIEVENFDFTTPGGRRNPLIFKEDEIVVMGVPTIAGRVPNLLLDFLKSIEGNGALGVPVVLYGNRNYDDSLIELRDIMADAGIKPVGGGAFIGEHSFSTTLGAGRPDREDMKIVEKLGKKLCEKIKSGDFSKVEVKGTPKPYRWYYQPRDRKGEKIDIRKVKPLTNESCNDCKLCAEICPMGSIPFDNVKEVIGICMKCCACIKRCPQKAKYFDDKGYLYHKSELEAEYMDRKEPEIFL